MATPLGTDTTRIMRPRLLDCTFRDGGYYNDWDFPRDVVDDYLQATKAAGVDAVELGFRFLKNEGFKGACAFTSDAFLRSLPIPEGLLVGVMINAADLYTPIGWEAALERLFPVAAAETPLELVRIACHYQELAHAMQAAAWLHTRGYRVGLNLMQIADRTRAELQHLTQLAAAAPIEMLYFADSFGGLTPEATAEIVRHLRAGWTGPIGIHTHDNMGLALMNTLRAVAEGVAWVDATITGMGRGPGNARTEEVVIEFGDAEDHLRNLIPLLALIRRYFAPLKATCGWGTNTYYYLAGKYGIHPSYVQEMLADPRYREEDIMAVIEHLRVLGGKKFDTRLLDEARRFYVGAPRGTWSPAAELEGREVLIIGPGPGAAAHRAAVESYIQTGRPVVMALNTQTPVAEALITYRIACHPIRVMADAEKHLEAAQPLIAPYAMFPALLQDEMRGKEIRDFGIEVAEGTFEVQDRYGRIPSVLVLAYALAVAQSGRAARITLVGFDGYPPGDRRNVEVDEVLRLFQATYPATPLLALTPTVYTHLKGRSVYGH